MAEKLDPRQVVIFEELLQGTRNRFIDHPKWVEDLEF